jgi:four helix bundle protein
LPRSGLIDFSEGKGLAVHNFEKLEVWKRSVDLAVRLYGLLKDCRDYSMKDQMTRAAVSISSNIAEGSERGSQKEFAYFLRIAKGSAAELRTQVIIADRVNLLDSRACQEMIAELIEISQMLQGLINKTANKTATL